MTTELLAATEGRQETLECWVVVDEPADHREHIAQTISFHRCG
jgi:hypothetical protein